MSDLTARWSYIVLQFEEISNAGWSSQSPFVTNKSFADKKTFWVSTLAGDDRSSLEPVPGKSYVVSNITNADIIGGKLFDFSATAQPNLIGSVSRRQELTNGSVQSRAVGVHSVMGFSETRAVMLNSLRILNPTYIVAELTPSNYFYTATRKTYADAIGRFEDRWDKVVIWCGERGAELSDAAHLKTIDFGQCGEYIVAPATYAKLIALSAGVSIYPNFTLSYRAFFWSSLALTLAFYIVGAIIVSGRLLTYFVSNQLINNVLNIEKALFTTLFSIGSSLCILVFIIRVLIRMIV